MDSNTGLEQVVTEHAQAIIIAGCMLTFGALAGTYAYWARKTAKAYIATQDALAETYSTVNEFAGEMKEDFRKNMLEDED